MPMEQSPAVPGFACVTMDKAPTKPCSFTTPAQWMTRREVGERFALYGKVLETAMKDLPWEIDAKTGRKRYWVNCEIFCMERTSGKVTLVQKIVPDPEFYMERCGTSGKVTLVQRILPDPEF